MGCSLPEGCQCWDEAVALWSSAVESMEEPEGGAERLMSPANVLSDDAIEIMFIMASD